MFPDHRLDERSTAQSLITMAAGTGRDAKKSTEREAGQSSPGGLHDVADRAAVNWKAGLLAEGQGAGRRLWGASVRGVSLITESNGYRRRADFQRKAPAPPSTNGFNTETRDQTTSSEKLTDSPSLSRSSLNQTVKNQIARASVE